MKYNLNIPAVTPGISQRIKIMGKKHSWLHTSIFKDIIGNDGYLYRGKYHARAYEVAIHKTIISSMEDRLQSMKLKRNWCIVLHTFPGVSFHPCPRDAVSPVVFSNFDSAVEFIRRNGNKVRHLGYNGADVKSGYIICCGKRKLKHYIRLKAIYIEVLSTK